MRSISLYSLIDRRRRRKLQSMQSLRRRSARVGFGCAAFALLALVAGMLAGGLAFARLVDGLPSLAPLPGMFDAQQGVLMQPTRIYDRSGQQLLLSLENTGISRAYLSVDPNRPDHFSPQLVRVTIAALDPDFWRSPGFSLVALVSYSPVTIPERLVDGLLLWKEPAGLRRALRMRILAAQMIARYGHVQVLEWYLNSAYYGHRAFGAGSAAQLYLEKPAGSLDLAESAMLLSANQAPALNPLDAPAAAIERQREILDLLLVRGVISEDEHREAAAEKVNLARSVPPSPSPAAAFTNLVVDALAERFGSERLERGGLRVITTLDYSLQQELACLARTQLARLSGQPGGSPLPGGEACASARLLPTIPPGSQPLPAGVSASAVVLDPQNGQVLALLGDATSAGEGEFLLPHQPGSLLTPFVAVTGFARGISPATLEWDIPASLPEGLAAMENPDGQFHGPVRLRTALANDYLAPLAQMVDQMGASNVWRLAAVFGLPSLAGETKPGLLYSGGRTSPLEIAQAYSVFASSGLRAGQRITAGGDLRPAMVLYVEDLDGSPWYDGRQAEVQPVTTPQIAYLAHHILSDTTARWPSLGYPNALEIGRPSGAKIGQVEGSHQVWTVGYTPQRVAVFWLGLPEGGENQNADAKVDPRMSAGLWHALMQYAHRSTPPSDWTQPAGISRMEVCDPSGQLPTPACPEVVSEVFLNGSEPTAPDTLYRRFQINRETGLLATVFTPPSLVEEKTFLVPPPQARAWAVAQKLPVPPEDYDAIQPVEPTAPVRIGDPEMFAYVRGQVKVRGRWAGDDFRSYQVMVGKGLNPETWLQVSTDGSSPGVDGVLGVWDTQGQEGLYAVRLQVVRQDLTVDTATIQVTVDNTPPLVRIPYPINGQSFTRSEQPVITFQAEASDAIGVTRLVWKLDGKTAGETLQQPFAFPWNASTGEHVLEVRAYDLAGNEGISEQVKFTVK